MTWWTTPQEQSTRPRRQYGTASAHVTLRARRMRSSVIRDLLRLTERPHVISLAGGLPAAELFPLADLQLAMAGLDPSALQYGRTEGVGTLREWIAADAAAENGGPVDSGQVLVTHGSQQALDLIATCLLDEGDVVAIDDPAYLGALQAFEGSGVRFLAIPVDADGMDVEVLAEKLAAGAGISCCYTVTEHGNPSGATLSPSRRVRLAELADRYDFFVVEDSPYRRLAFDGSAPPSPVATHTERSLRLGTFSKLLAPGLRVGWVVGPTRLITTLARVKQSTDLHTTTLGQRLATALVTRDGWLDRHIAEVVACYAERCGALVGALHDRFGGDVELTPPRGGMFVWARLRGLEISTTDLLPTAVAAGVAFVPGAAFTPPGSGDPNRHDDALRLSFATVPPDQLQDAVDRLAKHCR